YQITNLPNYQISNRNPSRSAIGIPHAQNRRIRDFRKTPTSILSLRVVSDVGPAYPEDNVLGDVGGVVGHALQVAGDDERIQQVAMVAVGLAHTVVHGFEDLPVHVVDQVVALEHGLGHFHVGGQKGVEGVTHHADAELGHARDIDVEDRVR